MEVVYEGAWAVLSWGATAATGAAVWLAIRNVHTVSQSSKAQSQGYYDHQRQQLSNHGFLRISYVLGAVVYIAALTYAQMSAAPEDVQAGQAAGLLLAYCVVMFVLWSVIAFLVPFFQSLLIAYNGVVSVCIFTFYALYCNSAHSLGIMHTTDNLERVLSYNLLWLLEDAPYSTYQWPLASMSLLHMVTHLRHARHTQAAPLQALLLVSLYACFGLALPRILHSALRNTMKPVSLPAPLFRTICTAANALSVSDLVLRIPLVARPLHAAARSGNWLAALVTALQADVSSPRSAVAAASVEAAHALGWSPQLMFSATATLLLSAVACCAVLTLCEEPEQAAAADVGSPQPVHSNRLVKAAAEVPSLKPVLVFLRGLDGPRRLTLCLVLSMGCMQLVTMVLIVGTLLLSVEGGSHILRYTPLVLLHVLLGLGVQVLGVVYLVTPSSSSSSGSGRKPASKAKCQPVVPAPVAAPAEAREAAAAPQGSEVSGSSSHAPVRASSSTLRHSSTTHSMQVTNGEGPDNAVLAARLESLANYKAFMQGLDAQPDSYSLDEFIKGSANAIRGVFPQVHHASFCLLSSARSSVNMYTFLGEGSHKAPRINVAVAPSTLIYHVLNNCQPVFITNIANFPGPFSDVQFMRFVLGLKSVACLPLVSPAGRVLGVLRLGFQEPQDWPEQEKNISKQVALILSSGSSNMGGGAGASFQAPSGAASSAGMGLGVVPSMHGITSSRASSIDPTAASFPGGVLSPGGGISSRGYTGPETLWPAAPPAGLSGLPPAVLAAAQQSLELSSGSQAYPHMVLAPRQPGPPSSAAGSLGGAASRGLPHVLPPTFPGVSGSQGLVGVSGSQGSAAATEALPGVFSSSFYQPYSSPGALQDSRQQGVVYADPAAMSLLGGSQGHGPGPAGMELQGAFRGGGLVTNPLQLPPQGMPGEYPDVEPTQWQGTGNGTGTGAGSGYVGTGVSRAGTTRAGGTPSKATSSVETGDTGSEAGGAAAAAARRAGAYEDLKMMEVIGRGGFGSVYKALWRGRLVAVKVLEHGDDFLGCADSRGGLGHTHHQDRKLDMRSRRAALLEGAMTSTINHPNVVTTYDYRVVHLNPVPSQGLGTTRISQETHIVMEWCDRGSLQDAMEQGVFVIDKALRASKAVEVDMALLCMTLAEVSSAMDYLHTHRITHRDLKPKNVLLKSSKKDRRGFCAKVSDFGLSQVLPDALDRTQVSKNYSGTVTHMPPELIEDGKVYPQGDIYAFGIMMWEVYTGSTPYAHMAHPQIMVAVVTHNLRPRFPEGTPDWYKSLAAKCWHKDHKSRPSFGEITTLLMEHVGEPAWQAVLADADAPPARAP